MTTKRWDGAAFVDVAAIQRWDGSAWQPITIYKRWDGSAWVDITIPGGGGGGLSATVAPGSAVGDLFDAEPAPLFATVTSNNVTVSVTGGTGPYTYSWVRLSGDSAVSATASTSATTAFSATIGKNGEKTATFRCTVTDSLLATDTVSVSVTLTYTTDL